MLPQAKTTRSYSRGRLWLFRLGAIAVGLTVVFLFELALRVVGVEAFYEPAAPLVGFSEIRPLFVKNEAGNRYEIPKSRQAFFRPESFDAEKAANEYRIFCLGGSTVQGRPYSIETSFTTWLEINLQAAEPDTSWEVVNCGGVSYASYRLVPVMRETLAYQPDLFIVYTGHNEFLEERTYADIKRQPLWLRNLQDRVSQLRMARLLRSVFPAEPDTASIDLPAEVEALLDYQGGLAKYHRDDPWRDGVIHEYEQNLRCMVEIARSANVPLILVNPVSNVRDTPPFKVELNSSFSPEQATHFQKTWEAAKSSSWDELAEKLRLTKSVLTLDDRHAEALFLLAKVHEARGEFDQAKEAYLRAKDEDICPLRMLESMHETLHYVAKSTDTTLVDVRKVFEGDAEHGLPGDDLLLDHVHPRIEGHQRIADELIAELAAWGIVKPTSGWQDRRKELYKENFESLPDNYFPESVERLRGLKRWAAGRVNKMKLPGKTAE